MKTALNNYTMKRATDIPRNLDILQNKNKLFLE